MMGSELSSRVFLGRHGYGPRRRLCLGLAGKLLAGGQRHPPRSLVLDNIAAAFFGGRKVLTLWDRRGGGVMATYDYEVLVVGEVG